MPWTECENLHLLVGSIHSTSRLANATLGCTRSLLRFLQLDDDNPMSSPPVQHAASFGARSLSVQSPGIVSGVSYCIRFSGKVRGGTYHRGMSRLEDVSAKWRESKQAATDCWPIAREEPVNDLQKRTWQHVTGHFYTQTRSARKPSAPITPKFPTAAGWNAIAPAKSSEEERPYTGRVMLNLMPPGPASPRFSMPEAAANVNVPGAATATGRPLFPRYLNNKPEAGRFDHLPPPWGPRIGADSDNIQRRWPTLAS